MILYIIFEISPNKDKKMRSFKGPQNYQTNRFKSFLTSAMRQKLIGLFARVDIVHRRRLLQSVFSVLGQLSMHREAEFCFSVLLCVFMCVCPDARLSRQMAWLRINKGVSDPQERWVESDREAKLLRQHRLEKQRRPIIKE